jgi:peptidoglycan/LPS O-acetylase OafA/YrhL
LYLTHWFSFQLVSKLGGAAGIESGALWGLFFVVAMIIAHLANILLEIPMQRYLNGRLQQPGGQDKK